MMAAIIGSTLAAGTAWAQGWKGGQEDASFQKQENSGGSTFDGWKGNQEDAALTEQEKKDGMKGQPVGVNGFVPASSSGVTVYPTVMTDALLVKMEAAVPGNIRVEVYDLLGKKVWSEVRYQDAGSFNEPFHPGALTCGTYIVRVVKGGAAWVTKIQSAC